MKFNAQGGGGGQSIANLIKLKAGESVTGILRGEIHEFQHAFKPGEPMKTRFRLNLVTKVNGELTAMVFEFGWKVYEQLRTLNEGGWDLEKVFVKISRQGSTKNDTVWTVAPLPTPPTPESLAIAERIQLNDFSASHQQPDPHHNQAGPSGDGLPF